MTRDAIYRPCPPTHYYQTQLPPLEPMVLPPPIVLPAPFAVGCITPVSKENCYRNLLREAYVEARNRNLDHFANWFKDKLLEAGVDVY